MIYPGELTAILDLFDGLPEGERRENLMAFAEAAPQWAPGEGERFDFEDLRQDAECSDKVGVYLRVEGGKSHFKMSLGPQVQTLTRAMATILCRGLDGCSIDEVIALPRDFVSDIVGAELVRLRSRTVYYVLSRMKEAAQSHQNTHQPPQ
jgi:cysteine desulfuration protein SufE